MEGPPDPAPTRPQRPRISVNDPRVLAQLRGPRFAREGEVGTGENDERAPSARVRERLEEAIDDGAHVEPLRAPAKKGKSRGPQSDHFVFTVNNPKQLLDINPWRNLQYIVYQLEQSKPNAQGNRTPHFQGYAQFSARTYAASFTEKLRKAAGNHTGSLFTECANGSDEENETYCTKEENKDGTIARYEAEHLLVGIVRHGERQPRAGKKGGRTDLLAIQKKLDEGASVRDIAKDNFGTYLHNHRALAAYKDIMQVHRSPETHGDMKVIWIYGPSSTGKTTRVLQEADCPYEDIYWAPQPKASGIRYDNYNYQDVVVFDDYSAAAMSWTLLMRLLDPHPLEVPTDGGCKKFVSKRIIFTSILHPALHYKQMLDKLGREWTELERRITTLIHLTEVREAGFRGGRHPGPPVEGETLNGSALLHNGQIYIPHP